MALTRTNLPFGLREVSLKPLDASETPGTKVDLPHSRTFSFSETEDFEDLRGGDVLVAAHGAGPVVEWSLESGGIQLDAWVVMSGGTVTTSGTTPAQVKKFTKLNTDSRPYFQTEGRAISDSGGDFHGIVYRCKADGSLEGEMAQGAFFLTSASGRGFGETSSGKLYEWFDNETAVANA